jgi:hypothetical protein
MDASVDVSVDACATLHGMRVFEATGVLQTFVADACVHKITIDAVGAQGGSGQSGFLDGGRGAHMKGDFELAPGTMLFVLVGTRGGNSSTVGGGGGGSFVWDPASPAQPYLVAGGGGGAGFSNSGGDGLATHNGGNGCSATAGGGSNGSGSVAPIPVTNWAAGGAGWTSDGIGGGGADAQPCGVATGGKAPSNGGAGGIAGGIPVSASGGFGGGGGAQGQCNATGGGGGGGYSGGGGGIDAGDQHFTCGGGGSSFNAGTNQMNNAGENAGAGAVSISW